MQLIGKGGSMKLLCDIILIAMVITLIASCGGCASSNEERAYLQKKEMTVELGNRYMTVCFSDNRFEVENHLTGRKIKAGSDAFEIGIEGQEALTIDSFDSKDWKSEKMEGGIRLVRNYRAKSGDIDLKIVYELGDDDFFMRRRLELSSKEPLELRKVDVWKVKVEGKATHQGFGEPVFLDDTFWGLEYPAGRNAYRDGTVVLSQYPGRSAKEFVSKTTVMGVAPRGEVAKKFREYVKTFRVTPEETSLFVNYNTWWTLMPPTEENCLALVELFKRELYDPYGVSIDTFTVDCGWQNYESLYEFHADHFPRGFTPLTEALEAIDARLGVWISPASRYYGSAAWGAAQGYELASNGFDLCQSGSKHRRDIVKRVGDLVRQYEPAFIKFDGFSAECETKGHGHLSGPYAVEANVDAYIELIEAVREARPGIYLDLTCGIWLSPWWLMYGDSLWGDISGDYPDIIVPAPILRDSATTTRDGLFSRRCREHPGVPPAAIEHLGLIVITPEKWEDNAMMVLGRGCRLLTLYIKPKLFRNGERDWAFLASILKWAKHNAETLQNTELLLGDPFKREVHGYAHFTGARGIIALRNPSIEPQTATVRLDETTGWSRSDALGSSGSDNAFVVRIIYPREETLGELLRYGATIEMTLQAFETVILHIDPVKAAGPALLGVRHHETGRSGKGVSFDVYGRPGRTIEPLIVGPHSPRGALLDGKPVSIVRTRDGLRLRLALEGKETECNVEGGELKATTSEGAWQIAGDCVVNVPAGTDARIYLLCEAQNTFREPFAYDARVNGKPVEVLVVEPPRGRGWTWLELSLPEGRNEVALDIKPASGGGAFRGSVGWWLWAEHSLKKATLTVEFDEPQPATPSEPRPLPLNMGSERRITTIRSPKDFNVGHPWPEPVSLASLDRPSVYLDEVVPDEAAQGWGTLQRRQSVGEREMTIAGKKFRRGLGTHANGKLVFNLPEGRFKRFRCLVGHDEEAPTGVIAFEVWVDGKKAFESGSMDRTAAAKSVDIDVEGAKVLELRTLDGGDGITCDHADWADARLIR